MRTIKHLAIIGVVALMSACASTANFPVSSTVPAADITATKKQDKNKNFVIEVTAINLAEASRLNPPKNNYSVWIVVENGITKMKSEYKELTIADLIVIALISLQVSITDACNLLDMTKNTMYTRRGTIKKRLKLNEDTNLEKWLSDYLPTAVVGTE